MAREAEDSRQWSEIEGRDGMKERREGERCDRLTLVCLDVLLDFDRELRSVGVDVGGNYIDVIGKLREKQSEREGNSPLFSFSYPPKSPLVVESGHTPAA